MSIDNPNELERVIMVTELIGLAETQRKIYNQLLRQMPDNLLAPYKLHEEELDLLIEYEHENNV